jgi:hypothetical protein
MLIMWYLIALGMLFLFSLTWRDGPARIAGTPERGDANKRKQDPQPNRLLES